MSKENTIFIQIASYRDPQLPLTLQNCIDNAKYPENLRFCICWQHDETENLDSFKNDPRFIILDYDYKLSKGACWARNAIQQNYNGEKYTLQLDSHHRFVKNWDEISINMIDELKKKGHKKPLLTAYLPSFDPENDPNMRVQAPWKMNFDRFIPEGAVFFLPAEIPNWQELTSPVPARFYSAHFCFTLGKFAKEVQHNPEYYFHGEEISIAVRAFTHGYDLFHPHKVIAWHEYTRKGRTKQWDDDKEWGTKNQISHLTNRKLFGMDGEIQQGHTGKYGFGKARTLREYEKYSGLHFGKRAVQQEVLDHKNPPNTIIEDDVQWENSFLKIFKHCIDIGYSEVPEKDYEYWVVAFHGEKEETLHRKDADANEIARLFGDPDKYCKIWREFNCESKPKYWVVWPYSKSKGWCTRISRNL